MPTRRGPILKKLRYYLSLVPPENIAPHKKLNASARAVLEANRGLQAGLADTIEDIQQRLLASYLRMRGRSGEL